MINKTQGFNKAKNMGGGYAAWVDKGFPVRINKQLDKGFGVSTA